MDVRNNSINKRRDSIAEYIESGSVKVSDDAIGGKITNALRKLGELALFRNNRASFVRTDLPLKSIRELRALYQASLTYAIKRDTYGNKNLSKGINTQEIKIAQTIAKYASPNIEAYCGEHAYITFDYLKNEGVPPAHMTVISAKLTTAPDHINHPLLLYSNKPIDKQKPLQTQSDKGFIIIDPWVSNNKVIELAQGLSSQQLDEIFINHFYGAMEGTAGVNKKDILKKNIEYRYDRSPVKESRYKKIVRLFTSYITRIH